MELKWKSHPDRPFHSLLADYSVPATLEIRQHAYGHYEVHLHSMGCIHDYGQFEKLSDCMKFIQEHLKNKIAIFKDVR